MISVVCIFNNKEILDNYLLKSLKTQTVDYELILIDNTKSKFDSTAEAFNKCAKNAKSKYIMFVHQDIDLMEDNWLKNAEDLLDSIQNLGIAGVAGKLNVKKGIITNIKDGIPPKDAGTTKIKNIMRVQTLDECLFIIPTSIFKMLKFNEELCDDWHLYAVNYCLEIMKLGFYVYVLPLSLYHRSSGFSISEKYYQTIKKMLNTHKHDYKWIYTTVGDWNTNYPFFIQLQINKLLFKIAKIRKG
jgi:hypothetical protein